MIEQQSALGKRSDKQTTLTLFPVWTTRGATLITIVDNSRAIRLVLDAGLLKFVGADENIHLLALLHVPEVLQHVHDLGPCCVVERKFPIARPNWKLEDDGGTAEVISEYEFRPMREVRNRQAWRSPVHRGG